MDVASAEAQHKYLMESGKITEADVTDFWLHNERLNHLRRHHCQLAFDSLPLCRDCEMISLDVMRRKAAACTEYGQD